MPNRQQPTHEEEMPENQNLAAPNGIPLYFTIDEFNALMEKLGEVPLKYSFQTVQLLQQKLQQGAQILAAQNNAAGLASPEQETASDTQEQESADKAQADEDHAQEIADGKEAA